MSVTATASYVTDTPISDNPATVAGFSAMSSTCWPGRRAAEIRIGGCNLRCSYCHCPELLGTRRPGIGIAGVIERLDGRSGAITGVVVTGGEPTSQPQLPAIVSELAALGIPIRLDTNGTHPGVLETLLESRVLGFVAVDVKTTPERYDVVTGSHGVWERVQRSIDLVIASGVDHEFRTTCYPSALHSADLPRIARELVGGRRFALQQFQPQRTLDPAASSVRPFAADVLRKAALCCAVHIPTVVRGV